MKKMYQAPEVECYEMGKYCIGEGPSDNNGEVVPTGNENHTFEENEMVTDLSVSNNLWDD